MDLELSQGLIFGGPSAEIHSILLAVKSLLWPISPCPVDIPTAFGGHHMIDLPFAHFISPLFVNKK
jgi:hypothetical protein